MRHAKNAISRLWLVCVLFIILIGSASAATPQAASGNSQEDQFKNSASLRWMARELGISTPTAYNLSVAINFAIIAVLVGLLLRSKLPAIFRNRTQSIRQALDEARKLRAEAQQRLSAIESRLANLQSEIAALKSAAEQESLAQEEHMRIAAEEEKRRIVDTAEQEIAAAVRLAQRDFLSYTADLAVDLAGKRIRVDTSTDEALMSLFVRQPHRNGEN